MEKLFSIAHRLLTHAERGTSDHWTSGILSYMTEKFLAKMWHAHLKALQTAYRKGYDSARRSASQFPES